MRHHRLVFTGKYMTVACAIASFVQIKHKLNRVDKDSLLSNVNGSKVCAVYIFDVSGKMYSAHTLISLCVLCVRAKYNSSSSLRVCAVYFLPYRYVLRYV